MYRLPHFRRRRIVYEFFDVYCVRLFFRTVDVRALHGIMESSLAYLRGNGFFRKSMATRPRFLNSSLLSATDPVYITWRNLGMGLLRLPTLSSTSPYCAVCLGFYDHFHTLHALNQLGPFATDPLRGSCRGILQCSLLEA